MKKEKSTVREIMKRRSAIVHIYAEEITPAIRQDLLYGRMCGISKVCFHFLGMLEDEKNDTLKLQLQLLDIEQLKKMANEYNYLEVSLQFMSMKPHASYVEIYDGRHSIEVKKLEEYMKEIKNKKTPDEFYIPTEVKPEEGPFYKKFLKR